MKDFDLAAAKRGAKVCTRDGREARILCFDLSGREAYKLAVACKDINGQEGIYTYTLTGMSYKDAESNDDLMMADDDYLDKLERGEYDHIEDNLEMVGKPDHIGDATEKVDDPRSMGAEMAENNLRAASMWCGDMKRQLELERLRKTVEDLKCKAMSNKGQTPENWDYWRRMYAGMALQGLVASDKWRRMEMGDRVCVCVEMSDALIAELKKTQE